MHGGDGSMTHASFGNFLKMLFSLFWRISAFRRGSTVHASSWQHSIFHVWLIFFSINSNLKTVKYDFACFLGPHLQNITNTDFKLYYWESCRHNSLQMQGLQMILWFPGSYKAVVSMLSIPPISFCLDSPQDVCNFWKLSEGIGQKECVCMRSKMLIIMDDLPSSREYIIQKYCQCLIHNGMLQGKNNLMTME
jgi:hypothetical protein